VIWALVLVGAGSDQFGASWLKLLLAPRRPLGIFMCYCWAIEFGGSALLLSFGADAFETGPCSTAAALDFTNSCFSRTRCPCMFQGYCLVKKKALTGFGQVLLLSTLCKQVRDEAQAQSKSLASSSALAVSEVATAFLNPLSSSSASGGPVGAQ